MAKGEARATKIEGARTAASLVAERSGALLAGLELARALDAEGVHRARVASRRLREALAAIAGRRSARAARRVRRITRALGPVRELDVARDLLAALAAKLDPADAGAVSAFTRRLAALRERRADRALRRLPGLPGLARRLGAVTSRLALLDARHEAAWAEQTSRRMRARAGQLEEAMAQVGDRFAPERLHRVRVAAKKLRYAVEVARGPRLPSLLLGLQRAQGILGDLHDLVVLRALVADALPETPRELRPGLRKLAALALRECHALHARYVTERARLATCCVVARGA
jgi:CHAD domain-containing protein